MPFHHHVRFTIIFDVISCWHEHVLGVHWAVLMLSGDTGLLDHLLKHLADKTVTPEGDKLRRRHNTEGHMEYWLQSAASAQTGTLLSALH